MSDECDSEMVDEYRTLTKELFDLLINRLINKEIDYQTLDRSYQRLHQKDMLDNLLGGE